VVTITGLEPSPYGGINMLKPLISIKNVSKVFKDDHSPILPVLHTISFDVLEGEFLILVGPSGCGKSTLLRIMSLLEKNYTGTVTFENGLELKDINFVFQHFALFPWLTVSQNIEIGLLRKNYTPSQRHTLVIDQLRRLRLEKFAKAYPRDLSGGMKQRVGIARALATKPRLIFMDEPFSELDSFTAEALRQELLQIWHEHKMTIVMVTHLVEEAIELADRIGVMTPRPGQLEKIVTNSLPRPRAKRSPQFFDLEDHLYQLIKP